MLFGFLAGPPAGSFGTDLATHFQNSRQFGKKKLAGTAEFKLCCFRQLFAVSTGQMTDHLLASLSKIEWQYVLGYEPLEIMATLLGVLSLILLARERMLAWPLGILWAAISAYLAFFSWQLLSDAVLYALYIPIQIYCWTVWVRESGPQAAGDFVPSWLSRRQQMSLIMAATACIALWAVGISALSRGVAWVPEPAMLIRDSATTVLNFFAQFLMARKRMENWIFWLVVNVLGVHIYLAQDSAVYAVQYLIFLLLGLYGWREWHKHRARASAVPAVR